MEALRIIFEFVGGVLIAVMTYLFTRSHYERQRRDELADREFNRRAAIYDMRIQEAREAIDLHSTIISLARELARAFDEEDSLTQAVDMLMVYKDKFLRFPEMLMEALRKRSSIVLLDDENLSELYDELLDKILPAFEQIILIKENSRTVRHEVNTHFDEIKELIEKGKIRTVKEIPVDWDTKGFKKGIDFEKVQRDLRQAEGIITKMKARLDKLAISMK